MQNYKTDWTDTYSVLVLDQAILCKAIDKYLILRMESFHILLSFLGVLGKRMECSIFEEVLVESGAFTEGSVPGIMTERMHNRAMISAHKLVAEALERLLHDGLPSETLEDRFRNNICDIITETCQSFKYQSKKYRYQEIKQKEVKNIDTKQSNKRNNQNSKKSKDKTITANKETQMTGHEN